MTTFGKWKTTVLQWRHLECFHVSFRMANCLKSNMKKAVEVKKKKKNPYHNEMCFSSLIQKKVVLLIDYSKHWNSQKAHPVKSKGQRPYSPAVNHIQSVLHCVSISCTHDCGADICLAGCRTVYVYWPIPQTKQFAHPGIDTSTLPELSQRCFQNSIPCLKGLRSPGSPSINYQVKTNVPSICETSLRSITRLHKSLLVSTQQSPHLSFKWNEPLINEDDATIMMDASFQNFKLSDRRIVYDL